MAVRVFTHAFSGGEVTPEVFARFDVAHVAQSLATCRNFITLPHGPARNRTGTEFVKEVRDSTTRTRVIPFSFNATQTFAIEIGAGYFRLHTLGETLLAGTPPAFDPTILNVTGDLVTYLGRIWYSLHDVVGPPPAPAPPFGGLWYEMPADGTYEIPNPYAQGDLFDIHYTQSADVLTLVHPVHPVMELRRLGATNWQLVAVVFQPKIAAPTAVAAVASGAGATSYSYTTTAVSPDNNLEESAAAVTPATCTNDLTIAGHFNTVSCTAPAGAVRVNVYKLAQGLYGYIGQAAPGAGFVDDNITPDISQTPPLFDATFNSGAGLYPGAVAYFEQRRIFAGWSNAPQSVLGTRSGTEANIGYHIPTVADDRIAFTIAARQGSQIRHIVPAQELIVLTASNAFRVYSSDGGALTGPTVTIRPQSYTGANDAQPVIVGTSVLYAQANGGRMREMAFNMTNYGAFYVTNDVSLLAPHLFDYFNVVEMAMALSPYPILWVVNDQGALLGMTYEPQQQVSAWHRHDTDGAFESCCVITEQGEDFLYLVVARTIQGVTRRYIERLHTRKMTTQADAFFVDAGLTYSGAPTTDILAGLDHLEGKTVSILGDGAVMPQQVVTGGALPQPLQAACSTIQIGLPITADLQTLPLAIATPDAGQGRTKNLNRAWLRVKDSSGIFAGPSFTKLREFKQRTFEPYGSPPTWAQGQIELALDNSWNQDGQLCVRQTDPLPLTIVSATLEVAIGG